MLGGLLAGLVDLIYPKVCVVCKNRLGDKTAVEQLLCASCWGKIKMNLPPFCYRCGRHLEKPAWHKNICAACLKRPPAFDRAFAPCVYEGVVKELVHAFKYSGKDYLGTLLSRPMIEFIKEYRFPLEYLDLIVPMPLHKARLREREFNQAEILSNRIAEEFHKRVITDALVRRRNTKTQTDLKDAERFLNVKDSFAIARAEAIAGKNILLVDDVLTTAATASEAAGTLKAAGAKIVFVLTIAN